jgi:iron(III) transport system permease protein
VEQTQTRAGAHTARPALHLRATRPLREPGGLLAAAVGVALALLVLPPLYFVLHTSLVEDRGRLAGQFTLAHYQAVLSSLGAAAIVNSLLFAAGSAAVALLLGTLLAWTAERTDAPFRALPYLAAYVSFAIPGIVKTIGWILLLGPNAGLVNVAAQRLFGLADPPFNIFTLGGMIFIEGLLWAPVVFLLMAVPFQAMDPALEDAAALSGASRWQTLRRVTLPLARPSILAVLLLSPSILAVLLLTLVRAVESFEIPALLGIPGGVRVLTTQIYLQVSSGLYPRYGDAAAYGILLIAVAVALLLPYYRATRDAQRFATITGKGFRPSRLALDHWRPLGGALLLLLPLVQILPLFVLLWASFVVRLELPAADTVPALTTEHYRSVLNDPRLVASFANSLAVAVTSATVAVLLTFLAGWVVVRTRLAGRWLLDQLASLPIVFPGIVLGLAVLQTFLALPLPIYGTIWAIAIAYAIRLLPYGMRYSYSGLLGVHRELEESALTCGASPLRTLRAVLVPLLMPSLFAAWIYGFLLAMRELSVALMLYSPGAQVVSVSIWELWANGLVGEIAAMSVLFTAITVSLAVVFRRLSRAGGLHGA